MHISKHSNINQQTVPRGTVSSSDDDQKHAFDDLDTQLHARIQAKTKPFTESRTAVTYEAVPSTKYGVDTTLSWYVSQNTYLYTSMHV